MKTKKVKIAVYMAPDGKWSAGGWEAGKRGGKTHLDSVLDLACDTCDCPAESLRLTWVEAEVPLPEKPVTVKGRVVA